jgi:hypothetical protein
MLTLLFQSLVTTTGIQQQPQPQATKLVTATGKPLVAGTTTTATANLRMLGPAAGGLNLAHIGGKPVLLASKAQPAPIQGAAGQVIIACYKPSHHDDIGCPSKIKELL